MTFYAGRKVASGNREYEIVQICGNCQNCYQYEAVFFVRPGDGITKLLIRRTDEFGLKLRWREKHNRDYVYSVCLSDQIISRDTNCKWYDGFELQKLAGGGYLNDIPRDILYSIQQYVSPILYLCPCFIDNYIAKTSLRRDDDILEIFNSKSVIITDDDKMITPESTSAIPIPGSPCAVFQYAGSFMQYVVLKVRNESRSFVYRIYIKDDPSDDLKLIKKGICTIVTDIGDINVYKFLGTYGIKGVWFNPRAQWVLISPDEVEHADIYYKIDGVNNYLRTGHINYLIYNNDITTFRNHGRNYYASGQYIFYVDRYLLSVKLAAGDTVIARTPCHNLEAVITGPDYILFIINIGIWKLRLFHVGVFTDYILLNVGVEDVPCALYYHAQQQTLLELLSKGIFCSIDQYCKNCRSVTSVMDDRITYRFSPNYCELRNTYYSHNHTLYKVSGKYQAKPPQKASSVIGKLCMKSEPCQENRVEYVDRGTYDENGKYVEYEDEDGADVEYEEVGDEVDEFEDDRDEDDGVLDDEDYGDEVDAVLSEDAPDEDEY